MEYSKRKYLRHFSYYIWTFGVLNGIRLFGKIYFSKGLIQVKLPNYDLPIYLRAGTEDIEVFYQMFIEEQFKFPFLEFVPELTYEVL